MSEGLSILNPRPKRLPGPSLLHQLVPREVEDDRNAIEFRSSDGHVHSLTYRQLHCRANALARALQPLYQTKGASTPVHFVCPIFLPQSLDLYVAELAALKAGAAFCPISIDVPEERLRFILRDVSASVLLTTSALRPRLPDLEDIAVVVLDDENSQDVDEEPSLTIEASRAAYVLYTSGSTGQPKGVVVSHQAATQALLAHDRHIPPFNRFLQFASPTFDVSVFEIFFPLFRGCTVVSGDRRHMLNDLPAFLTEMHLDAAELTPSVTSSLIRSRDRVPSLKTLLTIGEMLKREVIEEFGGSADRDTILVAAYGPTEAAIHCTLQCSVAQDMSVGNIGSPLDTVSAFILRPSDSSSPVQGEPEILPLGEEGELGIGGHQLADGYLNRSDQTDTAFVWHSEFGRLYRTGDRARLTQSGVLECLGRISTGQVKLRGQRVELGEVEYAASRIPQLLSVVADVVDGNLVVFCLSNGTEVTKHAVQQACRAWLPTFMIPSDVVFVSELPYLDSGKVNRKALQQIYEQSRPSLPQHNGVSSGRIDQIIDSINEVLQVSVDTSTPLASIGLDSLSSIRLASHLKQKGFAQLDAIALLESRTIIDIERSLMDAETSDTAGYSTAAEASRLRHMVLSSPEVHKRSHEIVDVYAPTPVQLAMFHETAQDSRRYCNWIELSVRGHSIDEVQSAWKKLEKHHALLRAGFLSVDDPSTGYAIIVWKNNQSLQTQQPLNSTRNFRIETEEDMLRPCMVQFMETGNEVRILIQIHHAFYDQWSVDILRKDIVALLDGRNPSPAPSFQAISDYVATSKANAASPSSLHFFKDLLQDFVPTPFPMMSGVKAAPALQRTPWRNIADDLAGVSKKAQALGYSAHIVFQAAMTLLLGYYTGSTDVTYGVVFSGRHIPVDGIESVFGPCLATLPSRIEWSTTQTRSDLLRLIQQRNRELQKRSLTPLSLIQQGQNRGSGSRLFDTLFVWQETSLSSEEASQNVAEIDSADHHEFNLVLEFEPANDAVQARATYQQALITLDQIEVLLAQVRDTVHEILDQPQGLIGDLASSLPHTLLSISNAPPSSCIEGHDLIHAISEQAAIAPTSSALLFARSIRENEADADVLTYEELDHRSNRLARFLQSRGVLSDDLVCICMDKSIDMYIAILAIVKAGAGYVPLVPSTPAARISSILNQANVKLCLCDGETMKTFGDLGAPSCIQLSELNLSAVSSGPVITSATGSGLAYVVFTSGSTGTPKGVAVTRDNLLSNLQALQGLYKANPGDRLLQACSQAFDVSVFEIFFAFFTGMCLCSARHDVLFYDLEASIRALQISHLSLTPTVAALVDPANVPSVRFLVTAGEGVTDLVHRRWAGKGLHQGYGPSETTNICTINMNASQKDAINNVGQAFRNTSVFVIAIDAPFEVLPAGAFGEFAFGGEQVFRGYIGLDELNAKQIIHHPTFGRIYRSGDVGRLLHDGTLLISGRLDDQVKLRGNRIELGEISAVLLEHPDVHDCAVTLIENETNAQSLGAFIVPTQAHAKGLDETVLAVATAIQIPELFDHLSSALPQYMVPDIIVPVTALPRTSQGKLDKRYLGSLLDDLDHQIKSGFSRGSEEPDDSVDWTETELKIAEVLRECLEIPDATIGRKQSLVSVGLNSLSAMSFAKRLSARLGTRVDVSAVLRTSSTDRLARALSTPSVPVPDDNSTQAKDLLPAGLVEEVRKTNTISDSDIDCILPCTPLQEAMLSADTSDTPLTYSNSLKLGVRGDLENLKRCWTQMMSRHTILRTRFCATNDPAYPFVQVVLNRLDLPWEDCKDRDAVQNASMQRKERPNIPLDAANVHQPFRISAQTSSCGTTLTLQMHHAIYDGLSMSILLDEIETAYHGRPLSSQPSVIPFLREVLAQRGDDTLSFWRGQVKEFRPISFPLLEPSAPLEELQLKHTMTVSQADIESYCKRYDISTLAVFQTALTKVLQNLQNSQDLCFGNVVNGRTLSIDGIDRLVMPCFNTVPVRVQIRTRETNLDLVQKLNSHNIAMLDYQLAPLRRIQSLSLSPSKRLFDCLLILQPPLSKLDNSIWTVEAETGAMDLPLVFEVLPESGGYEVVLHFSQQYFSQDLAESIAQAFHASLVSCTSYPHGLVKDIAEFDCTDVEGILKQDDTPFTAKQMPNGVDDQEWTETEDAVRDAFAQLSRAPHDSIQKDTTIYQLGLDSLNAPQVAHHLRSQGFEVDAADVMESPTPSSLAAVIKNLEKGRKSVGIDLLAFDQQWRQTILQSAEADHDEVEAILPCTSLQSGMLAQSVHANGKLYINHVTYEVPRSYSLADLQSAWDAVRKRHQILRMGFVQLQNVQYPFAMLIRHYESLSLPWYEAPKGSTICDIEQQSNAQVMKCLHTQPWRITVQQEEGKNRMTLSIHHALYDADCLDLILSGVAMAITNTSMRRSSNIDSMAGAVLAAETDREGHAAQFWRDRLYAADIYKFPDLTPEVVKTGEMCAADLVSQTSTLAIQQFCKTHNATIQAVGQTAWAQLLSAYTGDDNVTFGTVFSGGPGDDHGTLAFPSITTVPVPCKTTDRPFDVLQKMVDFNASAWRHRFLPLSEIQRVAGRTNRELFDSVFAYQKSKSALNGSTWAIIRESASAEYCVSLELEAPEAGQTLLRLTFDTKRIPLEHAKLMLRQYDRLLSTLLQVERPDATSPDNIWSQIPPKQHSLPSSTTLLHEKLEQSAFMHGNRPALEFIYGTRVEESFSTVWSYTEFDEAANQVAHLIERSGVSKGAIVAVCMEKCPEASFAFAGILKAGCAFLAVDPGLPESRLQFILEDSDSQILLGDMVESPKSLPSGVKYVKLDEKALTDMPKTPVLDRSVSPDSLCYVLYTSGTTGSPKGCEITHENAVQAMLAFEILFAGRWNDGSRWLQFASYWFDVSVLEQFWSWGVGITVVGASRDLVLDDIPGFIRHCGITHIDLTPSLARLVHPEDVPCLWNGVFITGGEALKQDVIDHWGPKHTVANGYGPSETTIGVTMNPFIGPNAKPSNIGRQFENVGTFVLRPGSEEVVMRGCVGELCVSGKLVGKGYLNRPDLTAKSFPTLVQANERIYRTGDLVRMLADGSFAFIGRQDTQAKLRGQRLEIAEIDNVIQQSSQDITNVVSLVVKNEGGAEMLLSFLVTDSEQTSNELRLETSAAALQLVQTAKHACSRFLPGYMVPTHIIPIPFLPLTVNNKVDSKRIEAFFKTLSTRDLQQLQNTRYPNRPLSDSEQTVCACLQKLLSLEDGQVGATDNLFSLGLSSISAISLATALKRAGFTSASPAVVMQNPTVESLGQALSSHAPDSNTEAAAKQAALSITAFGRRYAHVAAQVLSVTSDAFEVVLPCTPLQQGLIIESLRDETRPYFNTFHYELGEVDISTLKNAWRKLSGSTQILRARFIDTDEGYIQAILRHADPEILEWQSFPGKLTTFVDERKQQWIMQNKSEIRKPFQIHLVNADRQQAMVVFIHHALYDGISFDLLMEELGKIYHQGESDSFAPKFSTALHYGPLQSIQGAEHFWGQRLLESRHISLFPISSDEPHSSVVSNFALDYTSRAESVRKRLGVSHQALLQSCFEIALSQLAPSVQVYGTVVSGRSIGLDGADRVRGPMFNTLPQGVGVQMASTIEDHIRHCHKANVEAMPFQHTPLRDIRKWCGMQSADRLFDALFIFQHRQTSQNDDLFQAVQTAPRADYPLTCEIELSDETRLNTTLLAQSQFFEIDDLHAFKQHLEKAYTCLCSENDEVLRETFEFVERNAANDPLNNDAISMEHLNGVHGFKWTDAAYHVRSVLADLSGVPVNDIDEHSSIFALGLDSIDAVKLSSRLKHAGVHISFSKLLQAQTIPRILQLSDSQATAPEANGETSRMESLAKELCDSSLATSVSSQDVEAIWPATPNQEALLADMIRTDFTDYFSHDILQLHPGTDTERLKLAWTSVVSTTPILRTSFSEVSASNIDIVFAQVIHRERTPRFDEHVLDGLQEIHQVFDAIRRDVLLNFQRTPSLRINFVTIQPHRYMVVSLAHAQYDGHSLALLHEDLHRAYCGHLEPRPSYDAFIGDSLEAVTPEAMRYWSAMLEGSRPCRLPGSEMIETSSKTYRSEKQCKVTVREARSFCQSRNISMQALTETAWALTLAHYTQCLDVVFGVVLACRDSEEAARVAFPMMNTVTMRSSLHGSRLEMLKYTQSVITERTQYQRTPLRNILISARRVEAEGDSSRASGLFDTLFIYQSKPSSDESEPSLYSSISGRSNVEYPLAVEVEVLGEQLVLRAAGKSNVLDDAGTARLLQKLDDVLRSITSAPHEPTVQFSQGSVSISGLEPFVNHSDKETRVTGGHREPDTIPVLDAATCELASKIVQVFAEVSKVEATEISRDSTIESIGIDSISAIKVASLLRIQSISLSVSQIIRAKSASRMALLTQKREDKGPSCSHMSSKEIISEAVSPYEPHNVAARLGTTAENIETILPATAGQIYMLSIWQKTGGQVFHPTFDYQLHTKLGLDRVRQAWAVLVDRQPILRTAFCATGTTDMPILQVVLHDIPDGFVKGNDNSNSHVHQPLVVLQAIPNSSGFLLRLRIHHALYDAVSLPILMEDFECLLARSSPSRPLLTFGDFVALSVTPRARQLQRDFWARYLQSAKVVELPQPSVAGPQTRVEVFRPALFKGVPRLEQRIRREASSIQAVLFAAYAKVYLHIADIKNGADTKSADDVVLGIYLANRSHLTNLDTLAAPTLNLVPLLVRNVRDKSALELAKQVQRDLDEITTVENSTAGLWEVYEWTGVRPDTFVNFLKLPEHVRRADDRVEEEKGKQTFLRALDDRRLKERCEVVAAPSSGFELPHVLKDFAVAPAYQHSVDIEMTVTDAGLDVGLFCPEEILSLDQAEEAFGELKRVLEQVC